MCDYRFIFYVRVSYCVFFFFFFQAEDGIRDLTVTGVQTCALPICLLGLLQLEHLDARADAGEDAEGDGLLRIDGAAARPARDALSAEQRQGGYFEWLERRGDDEQLAARLQSIDGAGDGLAVRRRGQDQVCPSELLQAFHGGGLLRIDVLLGAQLPDELRLVRAARDGAGPEAHARGELDGEGAKAA